ncbi:MAG: DUF1588 domain-containing protein [Polyangiaceae bacterium]
MFSRTNARETSARQAVVPRILKTAALAGAAALAACNGVIGDPPDGPDHRPACAVDAPLLVPMQRITSDQWRELVDELFGPGLTYTNGFPAPLKGYAYSTYADANTVGGVEVKSIMETAESVAMAAVDRVPACTGDETACASAYLGDLARRALRRDASAEELAILMKLYGDARADIAYAEAVGIAIAGLLQMPQFLYALEAKPAVGAAATTLDGQEIAQRMALLYWNGLPDDELLAAGASGALADPVKRVEQAKRMLVDPRGRAVLAGFLREWLMVKDFRAKTHPVDLQDALEEELRRDLDAALDAPDGLRLLLTSNHTEVNSVLEAFYGLPSVSTGPTDWRPVDLDPEVRVGILTHPLLLARFAHDLAPSDILRGKFVRLNLLCGQINAPPAGAQDKQAQIAPPGATIREQAEARLNDEVCGGCHRLMDPIGFGLSAFDGAGHYLGAGTADTKGNFAAPSDIAGEFDGARALGEKLATSGEVQACFATQWMRYALGKTESSDERCSTGLISADLAERSATLEDVFAGVVGTPAFVLRASEEAP